MIGSFAQTPVPLMGSVQTLSSTPMVPLTTSMQSFQTIPHPLDLTQAVDASIVPFPTESLGRGIDEYIIGQIGEPRPVSQAESTVVQEMQQILSQQPVQEQVVEIPTERVVERVV